MCTDSECDHCRESVSNCICDAIEWFLKDFICINLCYRLSALPYVIFALAQVIVIATTVKAGAKTTTNHTAILAALGALAVAEIALIAQCIIRNDDDRKCCSLVIGLICAATVGTCQAKDCQMFGPHIYVHCVLVVALGAVALAYDNSEFGIVVAAFMFAWFGARLLTLCLCTRHCLENPGESSGGVSVARYVVIEV